MSGEGLYPARGIPHHVPRHVRPPVDITHGRLWPGSHGFLGIIEIILNGIETAIGLLILGILALLSLLGLIPNPFPWLV